GPAPAADSGPALGGLMFFNPREASDAPALTEALRAHGAAVVERPMIQFVPPATWAPFDKRLQALSAQDWVAFTSATAVRFTLQRMRQLKLPASGLAIARLAAVGKGTAAALEGVELEVAVTPEKQQAEGLLAALKPALQPGDRVWLPRAEEGRESLSDGLRAAGFEVTMTPVYRTIPTTDGLGPVADALYGRKLDWLIFTSPSTAVNFFKLIPEGLQDQVVRGDLQNPAPRVACLGEVTAWAVRELGFRVHVVPQQQDIPGLVEAIVTMVRGAKSSIE
ncbi:MAG TPA: uroporphyrinogen-III synthase, partial [bacterium]